MIDFDRDYFTLRATAERSRAKFAPSRAIADIHLDLAERYERLIEGATERRMTSTR